MRIAVVLVVGTLALSVAGGAWWMIGAETITEDAPIAALPLPPFPPRLTEDPVYESCLSALPEDPAAAHALIARWTAGGLPARHCQALAWIAEGRQSDGATALETLAETPDLPSRFRALLLDQAADAWAQARADDHAYRVIGRAVALVPGDPDLLVRHARVAGRIGRDTEAIDDLTRVLRIEPDRVDALLARAMAWRRLDRLDQARGDIDRAAGIAPTDAEVLLERGIQRQQGGDLLGAREDWLRVVDLEPDSEAADLAEQNLALLEAGPVRR